MTRCSQFIQSWRLSQHYGQCGRYKRSCRAMCSTTTESLLYRVQVHTTTPVNKADVLALIPQGGLQSSIPSSKQAVLVQPCETDKWPTEEPCPTFDAAMYFDHLDANITGTTLLTAARLHSTQSLLQDNRDALLDGSVCVADVQTMGKGRGGNEWTSPPGCLMFSCTRALQVSGSRLPFVQYAVCMAVVDAVQEMYNAVRKACGLAAVAADQPPLLRVKWPNDLYTLAPSAAAASPANGNIAVASQGAPQECPAVGPGALKVGGILCHTAYKNDRFYVTMGVGLNVTNREPTTCVADIIMDALRHEGQHDVGGMLREAITREELLGRILTQNERLLNTITTVGFGPLHEPYLRYWLHSDQQVQLNETLANGEHVSVTVRGLTGSGYLMAEDAAGLRYELHPDGNSFDFFQGLVRKKL